MSISQAIVDAGIKAIGASRRRLPGAWTRVLLFLAGLAAGQVALAEKPPVRIGIDAEFGVPGSTSAQAVRLGVQIAVQEINERGGVLNGRRLLIEERDNRSVPARSIENLRELAALPDLAAVFCGKFSPVVVESLSLIHELKLPLLDPWAAADPITAHPYRPSYTFRLSLTDSWALETMLKSARRRGLRNIGILLPNTEWGRSSLRAAERYFRNQGDDMRLVGQRWYNSGDDSLLEPYRSLLAAGADALILVANDREGALLVREIARLPPGQRLPVIAHWGVTGGSFFDGAGPSLAQVDFSVVQTFSFLTARGPRAEAVLRAARRLGGIGSERELSSPVGVAHAYDLTQILARAIDIAGRVDRPAIRDALEQVRNYDGLVRRYRQAFTPNRHEALGPEQVFMARFAHDGAIEPVGGDR